MPRSLRRVLLVGCAAWTGVAHPGRAQDVQYWTEGYGTRALLLGGVVIGSSEDISTLYYNPGRLAQLPHAELLLSGSGYRYSSITYVNGLGAGKSLSSSSLSASPSMFAGELTFGFLGRSRLGYSVLTRQSFDGRVESHALTPDSSIDVTRLAFFSGSVQGQERLTETWVGVTWAYPLGTHIGVGLTEFVAVRSALWSGATAAQAIDTNGLVAAAIRTRQFNYSNWGLLSKVGLSGQWDKWSVGLTVTTPSLNVAGSGSAGRNLTIVDQGIASTPVTQVTSNFQADVPSHYTTPLSIGFGGARAFGPTRVHLSGEWFASEAAYHVLETQPFTAQTTGAPSTNDVVQELKAVFNYGVGVEHRFGPRRAVYASYRTDRTPLPDSSAANSSLAHWDLSHMTAGAQFSWLRANVVLGTDLAFGDRTPRIAINVIPSGDPDIPTGAKITYRSLTVFFAVNVVLNTSR